MDISHIIHIPPLNQFPRPESHVIRFGDSSDPTALVSRSLKSDFSFAVLIYATETKRQGFIFSHGFNLSWQGSCGEDISPSDLRDSSDVWPHHHLLPLTRDRVGRYPEGPSA